MCVGTLRFSIPHGQRLPDRAESRVAQFSEDRDHLGRGGDCFWDARDEGKSPLWHSSICFYLFLPFIFHRALVAVCCSCCLDLPLGFLGTGNAPPLVFGDAPLPLAGNMACFTHCDRDGNLQLHQGLGFHPFPRKAAKLPLCSGVPGEGRSLPNLQSCVACSYCAFHMILVQQNALPLVFQGFSPSLQSHESLVEAVGSSQ